MEAVKLIDEGKFATARSESSTERLGEYAAEPAESLPAVEVVGCG